METKTCRDCHIEKPIIDFRKNSRQCRKCEALYKKEYYKRIKEHKSEYGKKYREKNSKLYENYRKEHKEEMKKYNEKYYKENKQKIKETNTNYQRKRLKEDKLYKMKRQIRTMIFISFYRSNHYKKNKTEDIVKMNINNFVKYLLKTFENNYGYEWDGVEPVHIDHIIPLATAHTEEEVIKLCHYSNLQLLKSKDNLEKNCKLNWKLPK